MRWIFSADFQAEYENLDLCHAAWTQMLAICRERTLEGVAFLGDLKRAYNPIDTRVVQFWQDLIVQATEGYHLKVVVLLGNHDRVGMYADAQNWLSILRQAGAKAYDKAGVLPVDGGVFGLLPYTTRVEKWKKSARFVANRLQYETGTKVLLFHQELSGAYFNMGRVRADSKFRVDDMQIQHYMCCLGGHIHRYQAVDNRTVLYVGSPFCTDWGEANQAKGFTVIQDKVMYRIPSKIPGWYDPSVPGFKEQKSWEGARIRLHIPCPVGKDLTAVLDKGRQEAEKKYPGALIYVIPKMEEVVQESITVVASDPDDKKIKAYVDQTLPAAMTVDKEKVLAYLMYKLQKASGGSLLRHGNEVTFLNGKGKHFLSYNTLDVGYKDAGLVVVTAKNLSWPGGKSNGGGKTNYLSLLPVVLFGRTFKGQTHDAWAQRGTKETCTCSIAFKDSRGRRIYIRRHRHPTRLQLFVDKVDQSSGLGASSGKEGTQALIEQLSGFTWATLANSVYIDQHAVSTFLEGTQRERKQILERFQNLERFAEAQKIVSNDLKEAELARVDLGNDQIIIARSLSNCDQVIKELPKNAALKLKEAEKTYNTLNTLSRDMTTKAVAFDQQSTPIIQRMEGNVSRFEKELDARCIDIAQYRLHRDRLIKDIRLRQNGDKHCPYCLTPLDKKRMAKLVHEWEVQKAVLSKRIGKVERLVVSLRGRIDTVRNNISDLETRGLRLENDRKDRLSAALTAKENYRVWQTAANREAEVKKKWQQKRLNLHHRLLQLNNASRAYTDDIQLYTYCQEAFSRKGIPAFLNEHLCPMLNKAADYYSELFCDRHIQVRFEVKDGEFDVQVINAHGGESIEAQSAGEKKIAALVTVFALREVAPQCNVLILDEPGDGLDPQNARAFAAGIRKLKTRFGSIFLTSHNSHILGELSGERTVVVQKKNRISSVVN